MRHDQLVRSFFRAIEDGDLRRSLDLCDRDLAVVTPNHGVIGRSEFSQVMYALAYAFPDLHYELAGLQERSDLLEGRMTITGTHTRDLAIDLWELPVVPASGRRLVLPDEPLEVTFRTGKIRRLGSSLDGARGVLGLTEALGLVLERAGAMG